MLCLPDSLATAGCRYSSTQSNSVTLRPISDTGDVTFKPTSITLKATTKLGLEKKFPLVFAVVAKKTGRHTIRYEITGDVTCPCRPEPAGNVCQAGCPKGSGFLPLQPELMIVFNANHRSVFERLKIAVGTLPSGKYDRNILSGTSKFAFSSTDEWKTTTESKGGAKHAHSCGVVHAGLSNRKLPMSIAGGRTTVGQEFNSFGPVKGKECDAVPFFNDDILDYMQTGALGRGVLAQLSLPKWINLQDAGVPSARFSTSDLYVRAVRGEDIWRVKGCAGLPVERGVVYHVFQMARAVTLDLAGVPVTLDARTASQACLLLDVTTEGGCSKSGGVSFMVQVPEAVLSAISAHPLLQQLAKQGLAVKSGRLGIGGKLEAFPGKKPQFWNGAEHFEHGDSTKYNFYVGGTAVQTMGDTKLTIDGNFFMALPGLCGDFRDVLGSGAWSAAVRASVSLDYVMMGMPFELAVAEAKMLLSFGGANKREACTPYGYGNKANPSGVFFNGRLKTGNPFKNNIVGQFFPSLEADVDVYLLANEGTQFIPASVKKQWEDDLGAIIDHIKGLKSTVADALQIKNYDKLVFLAGSLRDLYSCAKSLGAAFCWASNPVYAKAVAKLVGIVDLVRKLVKEKTADLQAQTATIITSFTAAVQLLTSNVAAAGTRLAAELTDLSDGFGIKARAGLRIGSALFAYAGVQVELTYARAAALKQCDKFKFIYEDVFESFFIGTTPVIAKAQVVAVSGGLTSAELALDGKVTSRWQSGGRPKSKLFRGAKAGLVVRTWSITTVHALWVYLDCRGGCASRVELAYLSNSGWQSVMETVLPATKGWHALALRRNLDVKDWQLWRVLFTEQRLDGKVTSIPSTSGVYPPVHEIRLVGTGPRYAAAAEISFPFAVGLGSGVLDLVQIKSRAYGQAVIGLGAADLATSGTLDSIAKASPDGNFLLRLGVESSVLGIKTDTTAIFTVYFSTKDGAIGKFKGGTMTYAVSGDIWGLFRVRLGVTAYLLSSRIGFGVKGIFENTFQDKAKKAVHTFFTNLKDGATKRFDDAKKEVDRWQNQIGGVIKKLDGAKNALSSKQDAMRRGKAKLDGAKRALENAKAPFRRAQQKLRNAQAKVDNLCGYRDCRWFKPWNCVWNAACWLVRKGAYALLELAKFALEAPIAALDVAKIAIDAAKVIVDFAIAAVDIAKGALSVAQAGLRGIQLLLEGAKAALEVVKRVVAFGLDVANAFLKFLIGDLFNIRRASFEVEVSTRNPFKFDIRFDLTVLGVTMNNVGIGFDFSRAANSFGSLIDFLVGMVKKALGFRRRRDVANVLDHVQTQDEWANLRGEAVARVEEEVSRHARAASATTVNSTSASGEHIPAGAARATTTDPACTCFARVEDFLQQGLDALVVVGELEANLVQTRDRALETNHSFQRHISEFSFDSLNIQKPAVVASDLSMTRLADSVTSEAIENLPLIAILRSGISNQTTQILDMVAESPGWVESWLAGLQNTSLGCGTGDKAMECSGFADCGRAGLTFLIDELAVRQEDICANANATKLYLTQTGCSSHTAEVLRAERQFIALLKATRDTFVRIVNASASANLDRSTADLRVALGSMKQQAREDSIFCGEAPTFHVHPVGTVRTTGDNLELHCAASGIPIPVLSWSKDGRTLAGETTQRLQLVDLHVSDAGRYSCIASNSKGVTVSRPAAIKVYSRTDFELAVELEAAASIVSIGRDSWAQSISAFLGIAYDRIEGLADSSTAEKQAVSFTVLPYSLGGPGPTEVPTASANSNRTAEEANATNATGSRTAGATDPAPQSPKSNLEVYQHVAALACQLNFRPGSVQVAVSNETSFGLLSMRATFVARTSTPENATVGSFVYELVDPMDDAYPGNASYSVESIGSSTQFGIDPVRGHVSVRQSLDHEASAVETFRVTVHHSALYAESTSSCKQMAGRDWVTKAQQQNECHANFPVQELTGGSMSCLKLSALLTGVQPRCFHQDADVYVLRQACRLHCAAAGFSCGNTTHDYCPQMPTLNKLAAVVANTTASCDVDVLTKNGICVKPEARACDGHVMAEARDAVIGGDRSCSALDGFYQAARRCTGAMRVDEPLLDIVSANCTTNCPNLCKTCNSTGLDVVHRLQNAVASDAHVGCAELAGTLTQLGACQRDVAGTDAERIGVSAGLLGLQQQHCGDVPLLSDFAEFTLADLGRSVDTLRVDGASCDVAILPMIKAFSLCRDGLPMGEPVDSLLDMCWAACEVSGSSGNRCAGEATHELVLQVEISNHNDNRPLFDQDTYTFAVSEADKFVDGKSVGVVAADDADVNDLVRYTVRQHRVHTCEKQGECAAPWNSTRDVWKLTDGRSPLVDVGELSGAIFMAAPLDYEDVSFIELTIEAHDGNPAHTTSCVAVIAIEDSNDNAPILTVNRQAMVEENQPPGTVVVAMPTAQPAAKMLVRASDADSLDRGALVFSIRENSEASRRGVPFEIDRSSGAIMTTAFLNYEVQREYTMTIAVTDTVGHSTEGEVIISVRDADEFGFFAPVDAETLVPTTTEPVTENPVGLGRLTYFVIINETTQHGDVLFKAAAGESAGFGSSAVFAFHEATPAEMPFLVDASGWIVANGTFDREEKAHYTFDIVASHAGRATHATVDVSVADENDNAPVIVLPQSRHGAVPTLRIHVCGSWPHVDTQLPVTPSAVNASSGAGGPQYDALTATDADHGGNAAVSLHLIGAAVSGAGFPGNMSRASDRTVQHQKNAGTHSTAAPSSHPNTTSHNSTTGLPTAADPHRKVSSTEVTASLRLDPVTGRLCAAEPLPLCALIQVWVQARDGGSPQLGSSVVAVNARMAGYSTQACAPTDSVDATGADADIGDDGGTPAWVWVLVAVALVCVAIAATACLVHRRQDGQKSSGTLLELSTFKRQASIVAQKGVDYSVPLGASGADGQSPQVSAALKDGGGSQLKRKASSKVSQAGVDYDVPLDGDGAEYTDAPELQRTPFVNASQQGIDYHVPVSLQDGATGADAVYATAAAPGDTKETARVDRVAPSTGAGGAGGAAFAFGEDDIHPPMTRDAAEALLDQAPGTFLVRRKAGSTSALSMRKHGQFEHHVLSLDGDFRMVVNGGTPAVWCANVSELVQHLAQHADGVSVRLARPVRPAAHGSARDEVDFGWNTEETDAGVATAHTDKDLYSYGFEGGSVGESKVDGAGVEAGVCKGSEDQPSTAAAAATDDVHDLRPETAVSTTVPATSKSPYSYGFGDGDDAPTYDTIGDDGSSGGGDGGDGGMCIMLADVVTCGAGLVDMDAPPVSAGAAELYDEPPTPATGDAVDVYGAAAETAGSSVEMYDGFGAAAPLGVAATAVDMYGDDDEAGAGVDMYDSFDGDADDVVIGAVDVYDDVPAGVAMYC